VFLLSLPNTGQRHKGKGTHLHCGSVVGWGLNSSRPAQFSVLSVIPCWVLETQRSESFETEAETGVLQSQQGRPPDTRDSTALKHLEFGLLTSRTVRER
jgi:hypothetical protein